MSVPSVGETQALFCATLFDELVRGGVRDVVICPGSRSTPLALAAYRRADVRVHVRIDERGAGFFALGLARKSGQPVAVVVTSGTAAAELHAAVAEASQSYTPLIVLTADRPPELHGVGAPQTMPQRALYGSLVRAFEEPGVARPEAAPSWRPLAARMVQLASDGPVHANIALVDPLTTVTDETTPGRPDGAPWRTSSESPVTLYDASALRGKRVLVVAGLGAPPCASWCAEYGFALIGDATVLGSLAYVDGLLRHDGFAAAMRPDVILRFGGAPSSKVLSSRIREWHVPVIGFTSYRPLSDPDGVITDVTSAHGVSPVQADSAYRDTWLAAEARCTQQFVGLDFASGALTETAIARAVVRASGQQDRPLVIGASMSVREVEWYGESRRAWTHSNRGVNGIDGVTSTTLGVASASPNGAIGLMGDVTFLHDLSALVDAPRTPTTVVVVDNAGGHIFDFLPQREEVDADAFATLFTTARVVDIEAVARSLGCVARTVQTVGELDQALADCATKEGVTVLVARPTPATTTTSFHGWLQRSCARVANELLA